MGAYKRNVVVVIKISACIHGVLILCGCLLSRFLGSLYCPTLEWDVYTVVYMGTLNYTGGGDYTE